MYSPRRAPGWRLTLSFACALAYCCAIPAFAQSLPAGTFRSIKIGNLGGLKVEIPTSFASIVEYDGDPGFGERRKGGVPVRTYDSPIRGMFFEFRFPDMAFLSTPEIREQRRFTTPANTFWMHGLVTSGENLPGSDSLDRYKDALLSAKSFPYRELKAPVLGLSHFARLHPNPESEKYSSGSDEDLYFAYGASGRVTTLISCNDPGRNLYGYSSCQQKFYLSGVRATVEVSYRRELMSDWKKIENSLSSTIKGFSVEK